MDPVLEHDLSSPTKPWALSPLIATMPHFEHKRLSSDHASLPAFPPSQSIADDVSHVRVASTPPSCLSSRASSASSSSLSSKSSSSLSLASTSSSKSNTSSSSSSSKSSSRSKGKKRHSLSNANLYSASDRRSHFSDVPNRQEVEFGPQVNFSSFAQLLSAASISKWVLTSALIGSDHDGFLLRLSAV